MRKTKGFTLIELLIVVAVISILIGIALPRFKGMQDEGNIAKAKGELRTLQTAVESYYLHKKAYPATLTAITTAVPSVVAVLPDDPFGSGSYKYSTAGDYYIIYSVGPGATAGSATITSGGAAADTAEAIYATNGTPLDTSP